MYINNKVIFRIKIYAFTIYTRSNGRVSAESYFCNFLYNYFGVELKEAVYLWKKPEHYC